LALYGVKVIELELASIKNLINSINSKFIEACKEIIKCKGHIITTGMGKSGHIAQKASSTFSSTGTPSFFLHPSEASHGDLGMITKKDIIFILSNSGETKEIINIIPYIKNIGVPIISLTGNKKSKLAKVSTIHINVNIKKEACSIGLAPTASTTAALIMSDAIAISVSKEKELNKNDFLKMHPGGHIGRTFIKS